MLAYYAHAHSRTLSNAERSVVTLRSAHCVTAGKPLGLPLAQALPVQRIARRSVPAERPAPSLRSLRSLRSGSIYDS